MPEQAWAIIQTIVGALIAMLARVPVESWLLRRSAQAQYEWNAYQKLAETIGGPKGQILDAAFELHRRIKNLEGHMRTNDAGSQVKSWLEKPSGYYYRTFVYRLARLAAWIEVLRRQLPSVDVSLPNARQQWFFIRHLYFVRETYISTLLFQDLDYDDSREHAHIFAGSWHNIADSLIKRDDDGQLTVMWESEFDKKFDEWKSFRDNFKSLIDLLGRLDIVKGDDRSWCFRWARVKAIHYSCALLLMHFGSHMQREFTCITEARQVLDGLDIIADREFVAKVRKNLQDIQDHMVA